MGIFITKLASPNNTFMAFVYAIVKGIQTLNNTLYTFVSLKKYELLFNAQTNYMVRYLNDKFDPIMRRIYIANTVNTIYQWLYTRDEIATWNGTAWVYDDSFALWMTLLWDSGASYSVGDYISYNNNTYRALTINTGKQPDTNESDWELISHINFLFRNGEFFSESDFNVVMPSGLTYDLNQLIASIEKYKLSDKQYLIQVL